MTVNHIISHPGDTQKGTYGNFCWVLPLLCGLTMFQLHNSLWRACSQAIVGFHMTSLKFKLKAIDPTEILLSQCIRPAEN